MKNEFITYEQAHALKELGFDEPCLTYYHENKILENEIVFIRGSMFWNLPDIVEIAAPLYQQAFRWFREKHKLHSYIEGAYPWFRYYINSEDDRFEGHKHSFIEEAENACLDKLIEIVKNK